MMSELRGQMRANESQADRGRLSALIYQYLSEDITAFEFDEALDEFRGSPDPVIAFTVDTLWYFYDDCDDHLVVLSKPQWDYIQRLLLLLTSNCTLRKESKWCWSWTQIVAVIGLTLFVLLGIDIGWGWHLLLASIPFGVVSIMLSKVPQRAVFETDPLTPIIHPFATFGDLRTAYEAAQFKKVRYPREIEGRCIRRSISDELNLAQIHASWLMFAPIPLLFQALPRKESLTVATVE